MDSQNLNGISSLEDTPNSLHSQLIKMSLTSLEGKEMLLNTLLYALESKGDNEALAQLKFIYKNYLEIINQ